MLFGLHLEPAVLQLPTSTALRTWYAALASRHFRSRALLQLKYSNPSSLLKPDCYAIRAHQHLQHKRSNNTAGLPVSYHACVTSNDRITRDSLSNL